MATSKAVAEKEAGQMVAAGMYEADADAGFEEADRDSYAIPFVSILQSGSPQCKKSEGAYIKGAEEGNLFNSVKNEILPESITAIPVHFKRVFIEWAPREGSGGFVAEHNAADGLELLKQTVKNHDGQDELPNGNYLVDTRMHYLLIKAGDSWEGAVVSMSSTQVKKSRKWMTMMQSIKMHRADGEPFTPPSFSHKYTLSTVPESNDKGSWYGWKIENAGPVTDEHEYKSAKSFRTAILSGEVKEQPIQEAEQF